MPCPSRSWLGWLWMAVGGMLVVFALSPQPPQPIWSRIVISSIGVAVALVYGGLWPERPETSEGGSSVESGEGKEEGP